MRAGSLAPPMFQCIPSGAVNRFHRVEEARRNEREHHQHGVAVAALDSAHSPAPSLSYASQHYQHASSFLPSGGRSQEHDVSFPALAVERAETTSSRAGSAAAVSTAAPTSTNQTRIKPWSGSHSVRLPTVPKPPVVPERPRRGPLDTPTEDLQREQELKQQRQSARRSAAAPYLGQTDVQRVPMAAIKRFHKEMSDVLQEETRRRLTTERSARIVQRRLIHPQEDVKRWECTLASGGATRNQGRSALETGNTSKRVQGLGDVLAMQRIKRFRLPEGEEWGAVAVLNVKDALKDPTLQAASGSGRSDTTPVAMISNATVSVSVSGSPFASGLKQQSQHQLSPEHLHQQRRSVASRHLSTSVSRTESDIGHPLTQINNNNNNSSNVHSKLRGDSIFASNAMSPITAAVSVGAFGEGPNSPRDFLERNYSSLEASMNNDFNEAVLSRVANVRRKRADEDAAIEAELEASSKPANQHQPQQQQQRSPQQQDDANKKAAAHRKASVRFLPNPPTTNASPRRKPTSASRKEREEKPYVTQSISAGVPFFTLDSAFNVIQDDDEDKAAVAGPDSIIAGKKETAAKRRRQTILNQQQQTERHNKEQRSSLNDAQRQQSNSRLKPANLAARNSTVGEGSSGGGAGNKKQQQQQQRQPSPPAPKPTHDTALVSPILSHLSLSGAEGTTSTGGSGGSGSNNNKVAPKTTAFQLPQNLYRAPLQVQEQRVNSATNTIQLQTKCTPQLLRHAEADFMFLSCGKPFIPKETFLERGPEFIIEAHSSTYGKNVPFSDFLDEMARSPTAWGKESMCFSVFLHVVHPLWPVKELPQAIRLFANRLSWALGLTPEQCEQVAILWQHVDPIKKQTQPGVPAKEYIDFPRFLKMFTAHKNASKATSMSMDEGFYRNLFRIADGNADGVLSKREVAELIAHGPPRQHFMK